MPIICQICYKSFKSMITNTHLLTHNITINDYIKKYGKKSLTSKEYRRKQSLSNKGKNNPNYGNSLSDEAKRRISEKNKNKIPWNKGKKLSDDKKINLLKAIEKREEKYKKNILKHPRKGIKLSNETKEKISKGIKKYAKNNKDELSRRGYKSIKTKIKNGYNIAFFKDHHHTEKTKEKIRNKIREINKEKIKKTNKKYIEKIIKAELILLNDINDHFLQLQCRKCGYSFTRTKQIFQESKRNGYQICDYCFPKISNPSNQELELYNYIKTLTNKQIILNNRTILKNKQELDIVIPDLNLAFEYNGLYSHSELSGKDKNYHLEKTNRAKSAGYKLIHIFSDEWIYKQNIVKSKLNYLLNSITQKIYARNCTIKEINSKECNTFLNKYHLQGSGRSNLRYGLFYNNELISVITFSKTNISRKQNKNIWELNRFCTKNNIIIIGGFSKLFKQVIKINNIDKIISYVDKRWSNENNIYNKIGFKKLKDTPPNYWYTNYYKRFHRYSLRKNSKDTPQLTEWENRKLQGWDRVWDCGNLKYIWERKN